MPEANQKLLQYLREAHATEQALTRTLEAHVALTPTGTYRSKLDRHLAETREHAEEVEERLRELGEGTNLLRAGVGAAESLVGQVLALSKGPIDVVRGGSTEEKLLKNAKDECAAEALEIATYDALEVLGRSLGDDQTAELAARIRADEERMLAELREEIPRLTEDVVDTELTPEGRYAGTASRAVDAVRAARSVAGEATRKATRRARGAARQAREAPPVARTEGELRGAVASEEDLPIPDYDSLNVGEVTSRLGELSEVELATVDAYERKNRGRKTVLDKIESLSAASRGGATPG